MTFLHTHTGERLSINYTCEGCSTTTQRKWDYFLRDFRTVEIHNIDQRLLDIIFAIQQKAGSKGIIEGYFRVSIFKSKQLRSKSNGVASKILQLQGMALDFRVIDLDTKKICDIAFTVKRGGVGYYAKSNFVHTDTGRFRTW